MTRVLVSLDADLASSLALRYACQLASLTAMELQPIHVEEVEGERTSPGSGWVRRTWEAALLETGREEIARLIEVERATCQGTLLPARLCVGEREDEILRELNRGGYDLFVEGALHRFTAAEFTARLRSRLYRLAPCPIALVRNLAPLERVAFLLAGDEDAARLGEVYCRLLGRAELTVEVICYPDPHAPPREPTAAVEALRRSLAGCGREVAQVQLWEAPLDQAAEGLRDYGLVVAALPSAGQRGVSRLLGRSSATCLLVAQP